MDDFLPKPRKSAYTRRFLPAYVLSLHGNPPGSVVLGNTLSFLELSEKVGPTAPAHCACVSRALVMFGGEGGKIPHAAPSRSSCKLSVAFLVPVP